MTKLFGSSITLNTLYNQKRYLQQIKQLVYNQKIKGAARLFEQKQDEVPLFNFNFDESNLATALAVDIRKERYYLDYPHQREIIVKNKTRTIYKLLLTDKIVIGVFSQVLHELFNTINTPNNYAFQADKGAYQVVNDFSEYIREHRKKNVRDFYIFRTDIKSYTDEIQVQPGSLFWQKLDSFFASLKIKLTPYQRQLLQMMVRPAYYNSEDLLQTNLIGIPTGSPITSFIYNFYAHDIDKEMEKDKDLFYARYCDDILICYPDKEHVKVKGQEIIDMIYALSLSTNKKKDFWGYFNVPGKTCADPMYTGINFYNYLGYQISAKGTFSLSKPRQRKFLRIMISRINNVYYSMRFSSVDHAGTVICQAINDALTKPQMVEATAVALIRETCDLAQLKHLDYLIALYIAEITTSIKGVRAFRFITYAKIRNKWGLKSLVCLRNHTYE